MCEFLSALVLRDGQIICMPEYTDQHEHLIDMVGIADDSEYLAKFVRVEYTPKDGNHLDVDSYALRVDEQETPPWWKDDLAETVASNLRSRIERMIVTDERKILLGGCWILGEGAKVHQVVNARIFTMQGGTLTNMEGGTLTNMEGGTLTTMWGGTLTTMRGGTLTNMYGGTLTDMWGGTLTTMYGGTLTNMEGGTLTNDYRVKGM